MNKLKDKVATLYADGNMGGAIAKEFAREGAKVFLAGRIFNLTSGMIVQ